jgi:hypothetical protein
MRRRISTVRASAGAGACAALVILVSGCGGGSGFGAFAVTHTSGSSSVGASASTSNSVSASTSAAGPSGGPGGTAPSSFPESDQGAPTVGPLATSSPPPTGAVYTQLEALMAPYPADSRQWKVNKTGPLSLADFLQIFYAPSSQAQEKLVLTQRGFQGAVRHGWFAADGSQAEVYLIRLGSAAYAQAMYKDLRTNWTSAAAPAAAFDAPSVHGIGESLPTLDKLGDASAKVAFAAGATVAYVHVFTPSVPDRGAVTRLAQTQYAALPH